MDEFIFHIKEGTPVVINERILMEYVESQKLMLKAKTVVPSYLFSSTDYMPRIKEKMAEAVSKEVSSKMKWTIHPNMNVTGELIVMNEEQLKDLLKHFGVDL